ncbi:hypothetical protein PUNSTDRAFT_124289 [Punctularia strigosozonata HHB-11173 SS5]|uniref:uncharacterized protein n=1 Tax=Punctularia strigosozonata (strain HHB-11173) TaxID=741275 RepID=UPI000441731E|nr:uncharacterized protein PUNSTDRAFT_124289 [Punctularia strigosozonata HHB-11173 SS5]EIN12428.1 hypothetical protein PUNSTDRAFT_124289 [Punctularia strigosozonata HHB-11173 SS5]
MPRYGRRPMCAYAREEAAPVKLKKPRVKVVLTPEEKEEKKLLAATRKEMREKKKVWEEGLASEGRRVTYAIGTKVLFKSDAQRSFGLTPKEILSLPHQAFAGSSKTVYSLDSLKQLAERKRAALGPENFDYDARSIMDAAGGSMTDIGLTSMLTGNGVLATMKGEPRYTMTINGTRLTHLNGRPDKYDRMGY